VTERDRLHWDGRYAGDGLAPDGAADPPAAFAAHERLFPTRGQALDVACGRGRAAVWLAARGLTVRGVDVSPVAVRLARNLAERNGVADRCRFDVVDLDTGLPPGPPLDVLVCHRFREPRLYAAMVERLAPGGLLAVAVLSEVGCGPGQFRAQPGELAVAFAALTIVAQSEADGEAWLLATA
jgi:2-polyprenyl-3-methyl-5-hydroxy-6-metoxy-1,4-benzoquinol methylase